VSNLLSKDAILAAAMRPDVRTAEIEVPELGGSVRIREMTSSVRNRVEAVAVALQNGGDPAALDSATAHLIAECLIDEGGRPMLTVNEARRLMAARPRAAFRIRDAVMELSATSEEDVEALAELFGSAQSGNSTSA